MRIDHPSLVRAANAMRLAQWDNDKMMTPPTDWDELHEAIRAAYERMCRAAFDAVGIEVAQ